MSHPKINTQPIYQDEVKDKTIGNKIATYLSDFKWYNPSIALEEVEQVTAGDAIPSSEEEGGPETNVTLCDPPSLTAAWEYFEHLILPRRLADGASRTKVTNAKYQRAEPGAKKATKLYPVWDTPLDDMGDFGIGVGLYFVTLRYFVIVCFLAGVINIPNLFFLWSDAEGNYASPDARSGTRNEAAFTVRSSLICTNTLWMPCPTCTSETNYKEFVQADRYALDENGNYYILTNGCELNRLFGYTTFASLVFVLLAMYNFMRIQSQRTKEIDWSEQTSSDYSIQITNPPKGAKDPEVWKKFFEERFIGTMVTVCTVAVDNEEMVGKLIRRRRLLLQLRNCLPRNVGLNENNLDDVLDKAHNPNIFSKLFCCAKNTDIAIQEIKEIDEKLKELAKKEYAASGVFVTFETEEHQTRVLEGLAVPKARKNWLDENLKFDGEIILNVIVPGEPNSIRWDDLDESVWIRAIQKVVTFIMAAILVVGGAYLIVLANSHSPGIVAFTIIALNQITPRLVRLITRFESHRNESTYASSVYLKVTAIRWANTAIVLLLISPFTNILQNGECLLNSITALLIAEIVQRPILQLSDIWGNIKRHYFAPRALDQRRMNTAFMAGTYAIGERYTEITKVLFLTFFYGTLMPASFFYASAIFIMYYWMDKFCILRTWKQAPRIDSEISVTSMYVFLMTVVAYAVMAAYSISRFPFDNACKDGASDGSIGFDTTIQTLKNKAYNITVANDAQPYKFCNQDMLRYRAAAFPPLPKFQPEGEEWMTDDQELLAKLFGWGSIGVIAIVGVTFLQLFIRKRVLPLFIATSVAQEEAPDAKHFSEVETIYAYVPQVVIPGYLYPALLCEVDDSYNNLVGWNDPNNDGYEHHNMINDVDERSDSAFHIVKKWDP